VTGIDEHRGVARLDLLDEFGDRALHIDEPEVVAILDRETLFAQQGRVALGVGPRLLERVNVLISVVPMTSASRARTPRRKATPAAPR
jgi:hypothetical protein